MACVIFISSILTVSYCNLLSLTDPTIPTELSLCEPGTHFTYVDTTCWGSQDASYATCGTGTAQSPIDITTSSTTTTSTITGMVASIPPTDWNVVNNGHTVQVNVNTTGAATNPYSITVGGVTYSLNQFHFHTTSEHTLNGVSYAMEMHLVHTAADGSHAVVGVLFDSTNSNTDNTFMTNLMTSLGTLFPSSTTGGWPTDTDTPANASGVHTPVASTATNTTLDLAGFITGLNSGYYN